MGPSVAVISRAIPKWVVGGLVEVPFSLESHAYTVQMQGIALRLLPDEWFVGWGDQILKFDDQNGGYDLANNVFGRTPAMRSGTPNCMVMSVWLTGIRPPMSGRGL